MGFEPTASRTCWTFPGGVTATPRDHVEAFCPILCYSEIKKSELLKLPSFQEARVFQSLIHLYVSLIHLHVSLS